MEWERLSETIFRFRDSCNVYCLVNGHRSLAINAGTGAWIDSLQGLATPPTAVLCTHHFRDHSAGALQAAQRGMAVFAPYWEREFFEDAEGLFQRRETYIMYDNIWDLYGPTESIPITGWLKDWDELQVDGFRIEVIPTAGATPGAVSLLIECDGDRVLFCGELIRSSGKIPRIAPLQYNYNDLTGAVNLLNSISLVKKLDVDVLAPSLGPELIRSPNKALQRLSENLRSALAPRPEAAEALRLEPSAPLTEISPSVFQAHHAEASTYFIISRTGEVMAVDYGYDMTYRIGSAYPFPRNRMSTLHSLEEIERRTGSKRIDAVMVTHYHDDHVNGIPLLQRLFGTRCYAGENFAAILSAPERFAFPCTWPEPIRVEALPLDSEFKWNEFTFKLYAISGHTRFATLVEFEADGLKYMATGDQYFFSDQDRPGIGPSLHNHVYRNGTSLTSFSESNEIVRRVKPDIILPGHGSAYRTPSELYDRISAYDGEYRSIHTQLLALADEDIYFGVDGRAGWLEPYRCRADKAEVIRYRAHILNPYPESKRLTARLIGPPGWTGEGKDVEVDARSEMVVELTMTPPANVRCRRQAISLDLSSDSDLFGQVAEALVTIGHPVF